MPKKRTISDNVRKWNHDGEDVQSLPLHNTADPIAKTPGIDRPYLLGEVIEIPDVTTQYGDGQLLRIERIDGTRETWGCPTRLKMALSGIRLGSLVAIFPLAEKKKVKSGEAYDFVVFECRNAKDLPVESDFQDED